MVLYVDYDVVMGAYVAICDNDRVILLGAETESQAQAEADELMEEVLYDEC
jgi:hypothetical protein